MLNMHRSGLCVCVCVPIMTKDRCVSLMRMMMMIFFLVAKKMHQKKENQWLIDTTNKTKQKKHGSRVYACDELDKILHTHEMQCNFSVTVVPTISTTTTNNNKNKHDIPLHLLSWTARFLLFFLILFYCHSRQFNLSRIYLKHTHTHAHTISNELS